MGVNTEDYYWALRRLAIRKHVRMTTGNSTVPNGGSCALCKREWDDDAPEQHAPDCLAAPDQMD